MISPEETVKMLMTESERFTYYLTTLSPQDWSIP